MSQGVIRVARGEANRVSLRRRGVPRASRALAGSRLASWSRAAMNSFELNKILGAVLGCLPGPAVAQHHGQRDLRPAQAGQARLRHRGARKRRRPASPARRPRRRSRSPSCSPAPTWAAAKRPPRSASPATPSTRAARTGSARTCTASSAAPRRRCAGFNYSAAMKAKGGNWTIEELNAFCSIPKAAGAGHQHDLRRRSARHRARRPDRLPELQGRQSGAAAEGGRAPAPRRQAAQLTPSARLRGGRA